ncbi:MAG: exosortase/archaeosortase family protein [Phycisphaerae bacterium]
MTHAQTIPSRKVHAGVSSDAADVAVPVLTLLSALLWCYWPTILDLVHDWQTNDNYSVGQLVPLACLYLLWHDRKALARCAVVPCWWGVGVILAAQAARAFGLIQLYESAERYALVLTIIGVVLLVAGRHVFGRVKWLLLFLFLMVPLPGRIHNRISDPLQEVATTGAVFTLELFGVAVAREGNVMVLDDTIHVAVAEACSGLRMLTAFVVVACTLAYLVDRPRWQKVALITSSIPVAILCNLIRLFVTAVLFMNTDGAFAQRFFHDFAGLTMMPLAILLLVGELWLLARLVDDETPATA